MPAPPRAEPDQARHALHTASVRECGASGCRPFTRVGAAHPRLAFVLGFELVIDCHPFRPQVLGVTNVTGWSRFPKAILIVRIYAHIVVVCERSPSTSRSSRSRSRLFA